MDIGVDRKCMWMSGGGRTDPVVSFRVRLARNLDRRPFPHWAGAEERSSLRDELRGVLLKAWSFGEPVSYDMDKLSSVEKDILKERHLISQEFCGKGKGKGLVVSDDERLSVMINEEDHLRMQFIDAGMDIAEGWRRLDELDTAIDRLVRYAFSPRLGYLTACPSNVGTGLRASVMMHLPALKIIGEIDQVIKGLSKTGIMVRGLLGEGSAAHGNMFQLCSQTTMGEMEGKMLERVSKIAAEVADMEINSRARLLEDGRKVVLDQMGRALGIMQNARLISSGEELDMLSALKLGVQFKMVKGISHAGINDIMLLTQPGHLQKIRQKRLSVQARDEIRADMLRGFLKNAKLCG